MCGIFGAIGNNINPGIIRALAIANRRRGIHSLGFFNNTGLFVKRAGDPVDCLGLPKIDSFIESSACKGWFVAGHTRHATLGAVTTRNAHPFRYGRYIGCHNGIVDIPRNSDYAVDSQYLFDRLNQCNGDYQTAFADIDGYWALAWFDGESFFLQAHDNEVWIGRDKRGTWYYSSDYTHLAACAGKLDSVDCIDGGRTIRFDVKCRKYRSCKSFVSTYWDTWYDSFDKAKTADPNDQDDRGANPFYDDYPDDPNDPFYAGPAEDRRWARYSAWDDYVGTDERLR